MVQALGSGAYGSVYESRDTTTEKKVAMKRVTHLRESPTDAKRILREIAILARLDSAHVVRLSEVVIPASSMCNIDEVYIAMEICDTDMGKLLEAEINLNNVEINTMFYNLLVGLKYIHSAGVYHRDLKPANVFVNQNGDVKIGDFGLARAIGGEMLVVDNDDVEGDADIHPPQLMRRKTEHVVTRWYRAPELILKNSDYTEAIDIWSAGCIYAELLEMLDDNKSATSRRALFPGRCCSSLSPIRKIPREGDEQLEVIFSIIGTPSREELSAVGGSKACQYAQSFRNSYGNDLALRFPKAGSQELDLLGKMLIFKPEARIVVEGALAHPVFASLRDEVTETQATGKVVLDFEKYGQLNIAQLRENFLQEMKQLRRAT
jgi:mitogen-activated protein kinase 1/3